MVQFCMQLLDLLCVATFCDHFALSTLDPILRTLDDEFDSRSTKANFGLESASPLPQQ